MLLINNMLYTYLFDVVGDFYFKSIVTLIDNHANTTLKMQRGGWKVFQVEVNNGLILIWVISLEKKR